MNWSKKLSLLLVIPVLAACSASGGKKGGGDGGSAANNGNSNDGVVQEDVVQGPALIGVWESGCEAIDGGRAVKLRYEFKTGKQVIRGEDVFDSADCSKVVDYRTNGGSYRFLEKSDDGTFVVEYNLMRGFEEGFQTHKENLKRTGKKILVTYGMSGLGIVPNIELNRTDAPAEDADAVNDGNAPINNPVGEGFVPRVGQKLAYRYTSGGSSILLKYEIIEAESANGPFTVQIQKVTSEGLLLDTVTKKYAKLKSEAQLRQELKDCVARGGNLETAETDSGNYDSCYIMDMQNGMRKWYGVVPMFGLLRSQALNYSSDQVLISFEK